MIDRLFLLGVSSENVCSPGGLAKEPSKMNLAKTFQMPSNTSPTYFEAPRGRKIRFRDPGPEHGVQGHRKEFSTLGMGISCPSTIMDTAMGWRALSAGDHLHNGGWKTDTHNLTGPKEQH